LGYRNIFLSDQFSVAFSAVINILALVGLVKHRAGLLLPDLIVSVLGLALAGVLAVLECEDRIESD